MITLVSNHHASQLGRLARGKPKNFSAEEIKKRTKRLVEARKRLAEVRRKKRSKR